MQKKILQQVAYRLKFAALFICRIVAQLILDVKLNMTCYS